MNFDRFGGPFGSDFEVQTRCQKLLHIQSILGSILDCFGPVWARFGPVWARFGPPSCGFGPTSFGFKWDDGVGCAAFLCCRAVCNRCVALLVAILDRFWIVRSRFGVDFEPSGAYLGSFLGRSLADFGPRLAVLAAILD